MPRKLHYHKNYFLHILTFYYLQLSCHQLVIRIVERTLIANTEHQTNVFAIQEQLETLTKNVPQLKRKHVLHQHVVKLQNVGNVMELLSVPVQLVLMETLTLVALILMNVIQITDVVKMLPA